MSNGANPNIIPNDGIGRTTMIRAAYSGNLSIIQLLLNINKKYKYSFDWVKYKLIFYNIIYIYIHCIYIL